MLRKDLKWLWEVAIAPMMTALGIFGPTQSDNEAYWPRIWWVRSGSLNQFPLHAAGNHLQQSTENAIDRVISSYTPTIKSLIYAREQISSTFSPIQSPPSLLIVGMDQTPNQKALPHVNEEVDALSSPDVLPASVKKFTLLTPDKSEVLANLSCCQIVHFACHGKPDLSDPSQSRLLLKDWETDPLIVANITALRIQQPLFAYLSACHSASNNVEGLLDEGIHLTGSFQLAGFRHVIGTIWQIDDRRSVGVARDVYRTIGKDGYLDVSRSAEALHFAIRRLREETRIRARQETKDDPLVWAPYVHFGA